MITRKAGQGLRFIIKPEHLENISHMIRHGITVTISEVKVRLSIEAPDRVLGLRNELELLAYP